VNIAVHFIRARSNLILSCSSEGFSIYIFTIQWEGEGGEAGYRKKRQRRGKSR